ncbi:SRPBCC family protein [Microbacterium sp. 2FI]|uniref:SRPBCC family protein n=1 Tax=Microbacterium sp. 2FI TaxID=2502193 RepID=UPI0010F7AEE8|nr:SRPBCC family protein [Microbacterium sp. 2FI]
MPITSVTKDAEALTMTVVAEFPATVERLWNAYTDPRQIERFWGPPTWPATFYRHDVYPGGRSSYTMTGPDGETSSGFWEFLAVDPGRGFDVRDGFAADDGSENTDFPSVLMRFSFEATDAGSRVTTTTSFPTAEALEQLVGMGMEDGMREAMGQIDAVLADLASFAAERATEAQILDDTRIRVARVIRGSVEQVWRAHNDADLMKTWLLGPDGWEMTVCDLAERVGDSYRYEWAPVAGGPADGAPSFGFVGELLENDAPHRAVTTEQMIGMEGPGSVNEMTLTPVEGGTLLSIVITYPSTEVRDIVLATGMTDGMETSYARLESQLVPA